LPSLIPTGSTLLSCEVDELDEELLASGALCQAFDEKGFEIGHLLIDGDGKILGIEVEPEHRRKGIASQMLSELRAAGYQVEHDWENLRPDAVEWLRSLGEAAPRQP
jgi:ribosomal protein S18 acetylase RimI-like enzyme